MARPRYKSLNEFNNLDRISFHIAEFNDDLDHHLNSDPERQLSPTDIRRVNNSLKSILQEINTTKELIKFPTDDMLRQANIKLQNQKLTEQRDERAKESMHESLMTELDDSGDRI